MLKFGPWILDLQRFLLVSETIQRELDPLTFKLLCYFLRKGTSISTREDLIEHVWQTAHVDDNAIYRAISDLRKQLSHPNYDKPFVKTHHKKGYSFSVEVTTLAANNDEAPPSLESPSSNELISEPKLEFKKRKLKSAVFIVIFIVLLFSFATTLTNCTGGETRPLAHELQQPAPSLTWEPGAEFNPLLSYDDKYMAYRNHLDGKDQSYIVRRSDQLKVELKYQEYEIDVLSWQGYQNKLLAAVSNEQECRLALFDISTFPLVTSPTLLIPCGRQLNNSAYFSNNDDSLYYVKTVQGLNKSSIYHYSLSTKKETALLALNEIRGDILHFELSPDEQHLAYLAVDFKGPMNVGLVNLKDKAIKFTQPLKHAPYGFAIDWIESSGAFIFADKNVLHMVRTSDQKVTTIQLTDDFYAYYLELDKNKNLLYVPYVVRHASLVKADNLFKGHQTQHKSIYQSDMHNYSVGSALSGSVYFASTRTGSHEVWRAHDNVLTQISFLASQRSYFNSSQHAYDGSSYIGPIRESYDGKYILFKQDEKLKIINLADNKLFDFPELPAQICRYYWSSQGNDIIYSTEDNDSAKIWSFDLITRDITLLSDKGGRSLLVNEMGEAHYIEDNKLVNVHTGQYTLLELPEFNPHFSVLTSQYLFVHDAIRNLYRLELLTGKLEQEELLFSPGEMAIVGNGESIIYTRYKIADTSVKLYQMPQPE